MLILPKKYGRPNEATPAKWNAEYIDYNAPAGEGATPLAETTATSDVLAAPAIPPTGEIEAPPAATSDDSGPSKKRKHDEETAEEKAERKRKKKEKKEKKAKKGE